MLIKEGNTNNMQINKAEASQNEDDKVSVGARGDYYSSDFILENECDLLLPAPQKTFAHPLYHALDPWSPPTVGHGRPQDSPLVTRSHQNDAQGHECALTPVHMCF